MKVYFINAGTTYPKVDYKYTLMGVSWIKCRQIRSINICLFNHLVKVMWYVKDKKWQDPYK